MKENKRSKNIEDYRKDIFTLKNKIKSEEKYLEELKQKHSDVDIFAEESYTFSMKLKILECKSHFNQRQPQRY